MLVLLIGALATWRLTHMLQEETGPFRIFERLREAIDSLKNNPGGVKEGFYCFMCLSVWVSILLMALFYFAPLAFAIICGILSFSAIAIFIETYREQR